MTVDRLRSVGVIMGSQSDWATLRHAAEILDASRRSRMRRASSPPTARPDRLARLCARRARDARLEGDHRRRRRGRASARHVRRAGRRCRCWACRWKAHALKGMDSLLSIVQMPAGIPVGTLAIGRAGAVNAALLAAAMLATERLRHWPSGWMRCGRQQTETVGRLARRPAHDRRGRSPPNADASASSAAASSAACRPWRRPGWAIAATS